MFGEYEKVNDVEFDHPFRVGFGGVVTDAAPDVYGPLSVRHSDEHDVDIECLGEEWQPFSNGYTGQWMSRGSAVMHPSEFIGGRLEADILATPGVYVVTSVEVEPDADDEDPEPAGWIVLKRKTRRELRAEGATRG